MAAQQTGKPTRLQKIRRFPGWLRYIFIGLGLVSLGLLGFFWIRGVNNDTLNKDMTALFIVLTAMFAFLAMPPLYRSEHGQPTEEPSPAISYPVESLSAIDPPYTGSPAVSPTQSGPSQGIAGSPLNRAALLKELANEPPGVFQMVVSYLNISASELSGSSASPAIRADEVLTLVGNEHLQRVREAINWATGSNGIEVVRPGIEPRTQLVQEQQRSVEKQDAKELLPNTLRGCVEAAQRYVGHAFDLLDPRVDISPADKAKAARSLETAKKVIEHLKRLLQENPSHPEYESIIDQVRIITEQVDRYLLPYITPSASKHENFQQRFTTLQSALTKLDTLIPQ
jgi:hypothetical protein